MSEEFDEVRFRQRLDKALEKAKTVLDVNRKPTFPSDVPHSYEDKYLLAESVINLAVAADFNALEEMGFNEAALKKALEWAQTRSVTLRLRAEHKCVFLRETKREEESDTQVVTKLAGVFKRVDKTVTTITEYFWEFSGQWELIAFPGTDVDGRVVLQSRGGKCEMKTSANATPRPSATVYDPIDLNITWLLQQVKGDNRTSRFSINRGHEKCRTPRRNPDVKEAIRYFENSFEWSSRVHSYFLSDLFYAQQAHNLDVASINTQTLFSPILPLFEKQRQEQQQNVPAIQGSAANNNNNNNNNNNSQVAKVQGGAGGLVKYATVAPAGGAVVPANGASPLLSSEDFGGFLQEQRQSIAAKSDALAKVFPTNVKLITVQEAKLALLLHHRMDIALHTFDGVNFVESMLRKQIIAAIGKEVTPVEFGNYMVFHNRKVFARAFQPRPFNYPVRRPDHYPEGILSLEAEQADGSLPGPVYTVASRKTTNVPSTFALHASGNVGFSGEIYLHAWLQHQFSGESGLKLSVNARARQFSCFLVLLGRITGPGLFDPQYGMFVQNKDELKIPLDLETIPSAKEFKEAISALSPEQQEFANMYRGMQLSSTLFGVCVIQVKPQMEKLLKLHHDALTKEIALTQDLLELFVKYQIPPDQLSFEGAPDASPAARLAEVKHHVADMMQMIEDARNAVITEQKEKLAFQQPLVTAVSVRKPILSLAKNEKVKRTRKKMVEREDKMERKEKTSKSKKKERAEDSFVLADEVAVNEVQLMDAEIVAEPAPEAPAPDAGPAEPGPEKATKQVVPEKDESAKALDFTQVPKQLDDELERQDKEGAVRPTIINVGAVWTKRSTPNIIQAPTTSTLNVTEQRLEKQRCYDLLDALTKSGALTIDDATLHIVIALTHTFDKTVLETLVKDNTNPIEKVEKSQLLIASIIHNAPVSNLVKPTEVARIRGLNESLFVDSKGKKQ